MGHTLASVRQRPLSLASAASSSARLATCAFFVGGLFSTAAHGQAGANSPAPAASNPQVGTQLPAVTVTGHYDNAVGTSDAASQGTIRAELLKSRPALRPGEVLEFVPGVIVTQHSGDGKANQYFLRGFNLDHGTDFATSVNGVPVNMPTHAHGQGYSDLNFLMPEMVDRIEYRKGPYFAADGDFASAGSADIVYRKVVKPFGQVTVGGNGFRRAVVGGSGELAPGYTLTGAFEAQHYDGPWTVPEGLRKLNGVATLSAGTAASGWSASWMAYDAKWTSTDQIPQRLIDAGTYQGQAFSRFDSLNATDGGKTQRTSLSGEWHDQDGDVTTKVSGYVMRYQLKLYSDFTYFLNNPTEGDQFSQQDRRTVYGVSASRAFGHALGPLRARSEFGLQVRHDAIDLGLFDTVQRQITSTTRMDNVRETMLGLYGQTGVQWNDWLRSVVGLRATQVAYQVDSLLLAANSGSANAHLLSPKLALVAGPWARTEFFFNAGRGFHSNDARGTTATVDPSTGGAVSKVPGLVSSRGWEVGARTEIVPGLQTSLSFWKLNFDSELVYTGDEGTTEPNRASTRRGIEWSNRWVPNRWLLVDADLAWTRARFSQYDAAGPYIPNSIGRVGSVAVTVRDLGAWSASLQFRYLGSGPLIEDNSARSESSLVTNLRVSRKLTRTTDLTLDVFNLFDRKFDDIQYFYETRLPGESAAMADRVVHPGEPRSIRVTLRVGF